MENNAQQATQTFLANVADQMEAHAAELEGTGASGDGSTKSEPQFVSKLAYTACYSLSYGVCFPILLACHWIPKNNQFVRGLSDGQAAADRAADKTLDRFHQWRLSKSANADHAVQKEECIESGAEVLATA